MKTNKNNYLWGMKTPLLYTFSGDAPMAELIGAFVALYPNERAARARVDEILAQEVDDYRAVADVEHAAITGLGGILTERPPSDLGYGELQITIPAFVRDNPGCKAQAILDMVLRKYQPKKQPVTIDDLKAANNWNRISGALITLRQQGILVKSGKNYSIATGKAKPLDKSPVAAVERNIRKVISDGGKVSRNGDSNNLVIECANQRVEIPLTAAKQAAWMQEGSGE